MHHCPPSGKCYLTLKTSRCMTPNPYIVFLQQAKKAKKVMTPKLRKALYKKWKAEIDPCGSINDARKTQKFLLREDRYEPLTIQEYKVGNLDVPFAQADISAYIQLLRERLKQYRPDVNISDCRLFDVDYSAIQMGHDKCKHIYPVAMDKDSKEFMVFSYDPTKKHIDYYHHERVDAFEFFDGSGWTNVLHPIPYSCDASMLMILDFLVDGLEVPMEKTGWNIPLFRRKIRCSLARKALKYIEPFVHVTSPHSGSGNVAIDLLDDIPDPDEKGNIEWYIAKENVTTEGLLHRSDLFDSLLLRRGNVPEPKLRPVDILQMIGKILKENKSPLDLSLEELGVLKIVRPMNVMLKSLASLRPKKRLTDDVINKYIDIMNKSGSSVRSYIFNTHFYTGLKSGTNKAREKNLNVFDFQSILVPVNIPNVHWKLLHITFGQHLSGTIQCYDSSDSKAGAVEYVETFAIFLTDEYRRKYTGGNVDFKFKLVAIPTESSPQQGGGTDCGVFMLMNIRDLFHRRTPSFTQEQVESARLKIFDELLKKLGNRT